MALEVGVRHSHGTSFSNYSGRSTSQSQSSGSVTERSISGSTGHGLNGSIGGRRMSETYSSSSRGRETFSGGSRSSFSESSTFSR